MRVIPLLVFMIITSSVWAMDPQVAPTPPRTLALSASSDMKVAPNVAYLTVGVTTQHAVAKEAVAQNAQKMKSVVDALQKNMGIGGKVQTGNFQVSPTYRYDESTRKNVMTGYEVNNQVSIETTHLDTMGQLIDVTITAGASQIQSLQFGRTDMDALTTQATVAAIQKAKDDAAKMAAGAGVSLGNILAISTGNMPQPPGPLFKEMRMMAATSDASTPVIPGAITVSSSVSMIYAIDG